MTLTEGANVHVNTVMVRRSPNVLWRRSIAGVVLLPVGGDPVVLSGAGSLLWDLLAEDQPFGLLADQLARACGLDSDIADAALGDILDQLCRAGATQRSQS